mmetsp:Transcript_24070/g.48263  ORF Transcript_24070/g.48263 Transcript_24070/m.48263 type:complete len:200 (+) Transcript_24070:122-721(+)
MAIHTNIFTKFMCTIAPLALMAALLAPGTLAFAPSSITHRSLSAVDSSRNFLAPLAPTTTFRHDSASSTSSATSLPMSQQNEQQPQQQSSLPVFLDPGTKGGAVVLSVILFVIPIILYQVVTGVFGVDEIEAGRDIGVGFSVITMILWGSTYIFRVATKDMTYAKQLKDYEDAVIAKRLEELDEDEVQALVEDIEREQF